MGQGPGEPADRDALHPHADQRDGIATRIDTVVPVGKSLDDIAQTTGKQAIAEQGYGPQIRVLSAAADTGETAADADRLDRQSQTSLVVGLEQDAAQRRLALGNLRAFAGHFGDEFKDRRALLHADHGIVIAAHSGIGLVGGAAGKIWLSAVGTWQCDPKTAETRPSAK